MKKKKSENIEKEWRDWYASLDSRGKTALQRAMTLHPDEFKHWCEQRKSLLHPKDFKSWTEEVLRKKP